MKKILCYLKTLKEFDTFVMALVNFGAIYIAHDYYEVSDRYIKSRNRIELKLRCQTCGAISISWRTL